MPRIPTRSPDQTPEQIKTLLKGVQKKMGLVPNMLRTLAHSQAALDGYLAFSSHLSGGKLTPALREKVALAVAERNECDYCIAAHSALSEKLGLDAQEILDARAAHSADKRTNEALRFAVKIVETAGHVSDEDVQNLRRVGFVDEEIIELVSLVALNIFTNYINEVAQPANDFQAVVTA